MKKIFSIFAFLLWISSYSDDLDIGLSLLSQGESEEAREYICRAYKKDGASPRTQFAYAKILTDAQAALDLYTKVADNKFAPDSLRSEAFYEKGAYYLCCNLYDSAMIFFSKASELTGNIKSKQMEAFAAFNNKGYKKAEAIWLTVISGENKRDASMALYYLGNNFYIQKEYEQAYNCYKKASSSKTGEWSTPAKIGACLSSYKCGNSSKSTILYKQIKTEYPYILEFHLLKEATPSKKEVIKKELTETEDFGKIDTDTLCEKEKSESKTKKLSYTLQVGAFVSKENAEKLSMKLQEDFKHVSLKEERIKGKLFHKVRIGAFSSEEDALEYGEKHLQKKDVKFRVVKE